MTDQNSESLPRETKLSRMSVAMDAYPPAFQGNELNLLFLDDACPITSTLDYLRSLDSPNLCEVRREYLISDQAFWPFPAYSVKERPDPYLLSEKIFENFEAAQRLLPVQRDIGRILYGQAKRSQPDIIALMVVDGLSYYDLTDQPEVKPCLVNGVSITDFGYRETIGKPSVSQRLFSLGYCNQVGFTYFDPESNELASDLHGVFGSSQVVRVSTFKGCLERIKADQMSRGFIQISAPGLDGICHHHQDEPPVEHYIDEILSRFEALISCLEAGHRRVLACLTADHGILWRYKLEGKWSVASDLQPDDSRSVRYIRGSRLRNYLLVRNCLNESYSMLRVPYITRRLRNNEWGVHGGISAWESIVPLIIRES